MCSRSDPHAVDAMITSTPSALSAQMFARKLMFDGGMECARSCLHVPDQSVSRWRRASLKRPAEHGRRRAAPRQKDAVNTANAAQDQRIRRLQPVQPAGKVNKDDVSHRSDSVTFPNGVSTSFTLRSSKKSS